MLSREGLEEQPFADKVREATEQQVASLALPSPAQAVYELAPMCGEAIHLFLRILKGWALTREVLDHSFTQP